jgi:hypothetical protein
MTTHKPLKVDYKAPIQRGKAPLKNSKTDNKLANDNAFNALLIQAIDETLQCLGETTKNAIYDNLKKNLQHRKRCSP